MRRSIQLSNGTIVAIDSRNLDVYVGNVLSEDYNVDHIFRAVLAILQNSTNHSGGIATRTVFFDIGANAGFISLQIAKLLGSSTYVFAFEPQSRLANTLSVSAQLNGFQNVQVFQTLVGNSNGEAELFVPRNGVLASSVWWNANTPGVRLVRCPIVSLDRMLDQKLIEPPTLIKIDVEGAERIVLEGAVNLLRRHRPMVIFESWATTPQQVADRNAILDLIRGAGRYDFYFVDAAAFRQLKETDDQQSVDIIAVPEGLRLPSSF